MRVVSNHVPAAPMLPSDVEGARRGPPICWLLGVFTDVPLAVTVNGLPLNAREDAVELPVVDDRLQRRRRSCPSLCHGS